MRRATIVLVVALLAGCGGEPASDVIDRDAFVAAWVDLCTAAQRAGGTALLESERDRVLQEHGVTQEQLLEFVDTHGDDPRFMVEVWSDVEARLLPPTPTDTAVPPSG